MKEVITEKMLHEIFTALERGENYSYSDGNTELIIGPNSLSLRYKSETPKKEDIKDKEVNEFLKYCEGIDDELFKEVCDTFDEGQLNELETSLDTDNYKNTIELFTQRIKEVAASRLAEICNAADAEIRRQELIIKDAHKAIDNIHKELDEAQRMYRV